MKLSIREAATLLGVPTRTVWARVSRGGIAATKTEGRWQLDSSALPLDSRAQRQRLSKASAIRQAVDAAPPSRIPGAPGRGLRSIADIQAIRLGTELLGRVRLLEPSQPEIERWIERAIMR